MSSHNLGPTLYPSSVGCLLAYRSILIGDVVGLRLLTGEGVALNVAAGLAVFVQLQLVKDLEVGVEHNGSRLAVRVDPFELPLAVGGASVGFIL